MKNKEKKLPKAVRQGDLLFIPRESNVPWATDKADKRNGFRKDGIIQEGEATGHHHRLDDLEKADVFRPKMGEPYVVVGPMGVGVIHEEHGRVTLDPSTTYDIHIAREFDPIEGERRVVD